MGALSSVVMQSVRAKPELSPDQAAMLARCQSIVGGAYNRLEVAWRDGTRTEKELLLHLAGCPMKWSTWRWDSIPDESQRQIRERARAMRSWLDRLVGVAQ